MLLSVNQAQNNKVHLLLKKVKSGMFSKKENFQFVPTEG